MGGGSNKHPRTALNVLFWKFEEPLALMSLAAAFFNCQPLHEYHSVFYVHT